MGLNALDVVPCYFLPRVSAQVVGAMIFPGFMKGRGKLLFASIGLHRMMALITFRGWSNSKKGRVVPGMLLDDFFRSIQTGKNMEYNKADIDVVME